MQSSIAISQPSYLLAQALADLAPGDTIELSTTIDRLRFIEIVDDVTLADGLLIGGTFFTGTVYHDTISDTYILTMQRNIYSTNCHSAHLGMFNPFFCSHESLS